MRKEINTETLRKAMDGAGVSASSLASELNVSREAVSKWLKGKSLPRPDKLLKLALLFDLTLDQLVNKISTESDPVIAFRKKGNRKTREAHLLQAMQMGNLLKPLVPYFPFDELIGPATLKNPKNEYGYLQKVVSKLRNEVKVSESESIDFHHLINKFKKLQTVVIPVLWGDKEQHKNALRIFLPDSKTTLIYLNLDSEVHDFKFWMAHELGHVYAPSLSGNEAEEFADAFASALLFSESLAKNAYQKLIQLHGKGKQINYIKSLAKKYTISPITIYKEINKYAQYNDLGVVNLDNVIYRAATNFNKSYLTLSEDLFDQTKPNAKEYIAVAKNEFSSPFFDSLKEYLSTQCKNAGFIQTILDIPLLDAKEICAELC